jgi:hypothetical protein
MSCGECLVLCKDVRRAARQLYLLCCMGVELGAREQQRLRVQVAGNWSELQNGQLNGLYNAQPVLGDQMRRVWHVACMGKIIKSPRSSEAKAL